MASALAPSLGAAQQRPRPLPLFLSLLRGETANDPKRLATALAGLRAYQQAARGPAPAAMPVVARAGRAVLRDYGGSGPPLVVVPSLINPPGVLDLEEDRSFLRWLARQGVRPLLVDWGSPTADDRALDVAGHVERMLLPLLDQLGEPAVLAGYCLGGTMALAAAALRPTRGLALLATPWRFSAYPDETSAALDGLWDQAAPSAERIGLMPMEVLQAAFWRLDPARTVAKFVSFAARDPDDPAARAFVRLEDWANDGPPLTFGAARELFDDLFTADAPGRGRWLVAGRIVDPAALSVPVLEIVSTTDRIVPAAATPGIGIGREVALGHVGMIVGGRARSAVWEPFARWVSEAVAT